MSTYSTVDVLAKVSAVRAVVVARVTGNLPPPTRPDGIVRHPARWSHDRALWFVV
jgi:hypothetical protein